MSALFFNLNYCPIKAIPQLAVAYTSGLSPIHRACRLYIGPVAYTSGLELGPGKFGSGKLDRAGKLAGDLIPEMLMSFLLKLLDPLKLPLGVPL